MSPNEQPLFDTVPLNAYDKRVFRAGTLESYMTWLINLIYLTTADNNVGVVRYNLSDNSITPILNSQYREVNAAVSNNGKYILYMSNESGRNEIYVSELDGEGGRWQISNDGGYAPRWRSDNNEIFFF